MDESAEVLNNLPEGYFYEMGGQYKEMQETFSTMFFALILAVILVAILGFAVLAGPYIENAEGTTPTDLGEAQNRREAFSTKQTVEVAKVYIVDFIIGMKQIFLQMPVYKHAIIAAHLGKKWLFKEISWNDWEKDKLPEKSRILKRDRGNFAIDKSY